MKTKTLMQKRHLSNKKARQSDSTNSDFLRDNNINFATQRDWILLDGSVKENFHHST